MNQIVLTLLCALVFGVNLTHSAGHAGGLSQRCLCRGKPVKAVKERLIRLVELFPPSPSCSKTEIVLTVIVKGKGKGKGKRKVCLDPNERQGQTLMKGKGRQNKNQRKKERKEKTKKFDIKDN